MIALSENAFAFHFKMFGFKYWCLCRLVNQSRVKDPHQARPLGGQNIGPSTSKVNTQRGQTSFAPVDFKFSPPSEVTPFEFRPMTPKSTANFLKPPSANSSGVLEDNIAKKPASVR